MSMHPHDDPEDPTANDCNYNFPQVLFAFVLGFILGSPMQASETELSYSPDWNQKMGIEARNNILDQAETSNSIVIGSHLSFPGWGRIIRWQGRRYWKAL